MTFFCASSIRLLGEYDSASALSPIVDTRATLGLCARRCSVVVHNVAAAAARIRLADYLWSSPKSPVSDNEHDQLAYPEHCTSEVRC